jgi:hypothetical protein
MNAVAKKLIQTAGLLLALGLSSTPAFCQQIGNNIPGIGQAIGSFNQALHNSSSGTSRLGSAVGRATKGLRASSTSSAATRTGPMLPATRLASLVSSSLPQTNLDSFVYQAGANADKIYGDEGTNGLPPLYGFTVASRINAGITGARDVGLTTGHGSYMPNAWGADEFLAPPQGEWSLSGTNNGNTQYNNAAANLDANDQTEAALNNSQTTGNGGSAAVFSGPGGVSPNPAYPNAPGPGYYAIIGCGGDFQGWMNPTEVALGQTNWGAALYSFYTSSEFIGDPLEAAYEISQIEASGDLNGGS